MNTDNQLECENQLEFLKWQRNGPKRMVTGFLEYCFDFY